ncbi:MAG: hypothetical protein ACKVS9_12695 [Phycisphaerae bacterium]
MMRFHVVVGMVAFYASPGAVLLAVDAVAPVAVLDGHIVAQRELQAQFPGVRFDESNSQIRSIYGKPMTAGDTSAEAAAAFWRDHAGAFGVESLELEELSAHESGRRFGVFMYRQTIDGIAVEHSVGRVLYNYDIGRVVYVGGTFAPRPPAGFAPDFLAAEDVVAAIEPLEEAHGLGIWSEPQLVIYAGTPDEMGLGTDDFGSPVRAYKITGENGVSYETEHYRRVTLFVDAATGEVVGVRSEVHHVDIAGSVMGFATPGTRADVPTNPPVLTPLANLRVNATGGLFAFSEPNGAFLIANDGETPLTVSTNMSSGRWLNVNPQAGTELSISLSNIVPPGPANFVFNPAPTEFATAQVNAIIHINAIHNLVTERTAWTGLDQVLPVHVNVSGSCNARFTGNVIEMFRAGSGCANSSFTSILAHEYGHFIVQRLGLQQFAFGEGFSDSCSIMLFDDPVLGRDFGPGLERNYSPGLPENPYPCPSTCGGGSHCCGMTLAGLWRDVREQTALLHPEPDALEISRQLWVDWGQITNGGISSNAAHPATTIEILTADDDDGDLSNGTPNYAAIRAASLAHSIPCPLVLPVNFEFPDGVPLTVSRNTTNVLRVNIQSGSQAINPETAFISYRAAGGSFADVPLIADGPGQYVAVLPTMTCGETADFYVGVQTMSGDTVTMPPSAPLRTFAVAASSTAADVLVDDFQGILGWTTAFTAPRGRWNRGNPDATIAQPEDDHSPTPGTFCWVTSGPAGTSPTANDVDAGTVTLISPVMNFAGATDAMISFWLWYSNNAGAAPNEDTVRIEISGDDTNWLPVTTVGPSGVEVGGGWYPHTIRVGSIMTPTATTKLRVIVEDVGGDSLVEALFDDFRAAAVTCVPPNCAADLDSDGTVGLTDLATLLSNFGAPSGASAAQGDIDGDSSVALADLAVLLTAFGVDCE